MGVVYRARYVGNNRMVAVKLVPDEVAANATLVARFERELEVLKQLRHPHIVHCFGGICESKQRFYAMELVEGGTLHNLIQEVGKLPWETVVDYGQQMCSALEYAHQRNVVHRDVKPGNFLLTKNGKLKLSDFGLAIVIASQRITAAGKTLGTFHYMAPEQIRGKPPVTNKTDLYALGCVLFEMLTGNPPFDADAAAEVLHKHLKEPPPRVRDLEPDCPLELDVLVADLLQKDPEQRPASAAAVEGRLKTATAAPSAVVSSLSLTPTSPRAVIETDSAPVIAPLPVKSSGPMNWWLAGGLALALLCLGYLQLHTSKWKARATKAEASLITLFNQGNLDLKLSVLRTLGQLDSYQPGTQQFVTEQLHSEDRALRLATVELMISRPVLAKAARGDLTRLKRTESFPEISQKADQALAASQLPGNESSVIGWLITLLAIGLIAGLGWFGWTWAKRNSLFQGT